MSPEEERFPITAAQLLGNFCETLFYGMYLVTCCFVANTLLLTGTGRDERWLRPHEIRWMMVFVAVALFAICTFDVAIGLLHNVNAFVKSDDATKEFFDTADWINIPRTVNQVIAMILGDFVLIHRCWVVHGRRWLVIVPSLILYLGGLAMAIKLVEEEAKSDTLRVIFLNTSQFRPWWIAFFAITVVQNALTTSILVWRIWRVERQSEKYMERSGTVIHQPRHLRKVIRVIAESGTAYTMIVFISFLVSVTKSNALYPTSDMALQATGIAFNVILVRSSAGRDQQFTVYDANGRTTIVEQRIAATTTLGSINFVPGQARSVVMTRGSQDVELSVKAINDIDKSSQSDIYPMGITSTKSVVKS